MVSILRKKNMRLRYTLVWYALQIDCPITYTERAHFVQSLLSKNQKAYVDHVG